MPLFDYHCSFCDKTFELMVKSSDQHPGCCPHCWCDRLVKQPSAPKGLILKGDGFYAPTKSTTESQ